MNQEQCSHQQAAGHGPGQIRQDQENEPGIQPMKQNVLNVVEPTVRAEELGVQQTG